MTPEQIKAAVAIVRDAGPLTSANTSAYFNAVDVLRQVAEKVAEAPTCSIFIEPNGLPGLDWVADEFDAIRSLAQTAGAAAALHIVRLADNKVASAS